MLLGSTFATLGNKECALR
uniref:Uncharacterized protein n=1 Tax=Echinococcus granulosus TaxID=6210 RepID=A0A068WYB7_ECHGR|nr:hypothetical protein EgrG_001185800 [Echinococcus granulosus]